MRCARISNFMYPKGKPFTDYPEQVVMMVKGKIYMGDINHSKKFAAEFLELVAAECREKIKVSFDEMLFQKRFSRKLKS